MRLIYLFVIVATFLLTIAQLLEIIAKSNDTQPCGTAESSEGNSSLDNISTLLCSITNATESIASQDCLCVTKPTSTQLGNSTTDRDTANETIRCAITNSSCSECDGSTEHNCLRCDSDDKVCCSTMCVNSSAGCDQEQVPESESLLYSFDFPLHVLLLVPFPDAIHKPAFDQGGAIVPAVELAAEQINNRSDILPGLRINMNIRDSGCDKVSKTAIEIVKTLRELHRLQKYNTVGGIIGPICSEESVFVGNLFNRRFFDEPLPVFYSGTSPYLSENVEERTNAYGMISSASVLIDTLLEIADREKWNWENVAIFYDGSRDFFQQIYDTFIHHLNNSNSQQIRYSRQISDSRIPLKRIIGMDYRIVVVFAGRKPARQLACLAGQLDFVFPIRQLIFPERTLDNFIGDENAERSFFERTEREKYDCDNEMVMRGLNGSILLNQVLDSVGPDVVTVSNYTVEEVKKQYRDRLSQYNEEHDSNFTESIYAYPYYDATWALAYGWEYSISYYANTFVNANYVLQNNVSFQGVSSWIDFRNENNQQVYNPVRISQINWSNAIPIALHNKSNPLTYPAGVFINDTFIAMNILLHPFLIAIGFISAFFLLMFVANIQILNVIHRNHPAVKASSQRLNHFIFVGCYLFVIAIINHTIQGIVPEAVGVISCNLDAVCIVLGYCLIISTVLAKSWRTYRIFSHPFKHTRFLGDLSLSLFIVGSVVLTMLSFIPFFVLHPFQRKDFPEFDTSQWPPVKKQTTVCDVSDSAFGYITIPLTLQLFLTAATIFLATLNKSIKYSDFRNTKEIFMFVYLLAATWAVGGSLLVIFYHLKDQIENILYPIRIALLVTTVVLSITILQLSAHYAQVSRTRQSMNGSPLSQIRPGPLRYSSTRITIVP